MQNDLSDITVILDRSGSMQSIQSDAEGGLNAFISKQKEQPGRANFTLVQFDDKYEVVHSGVPIRQVPHCKLVPRGNTALLDAVGRTINEVGDRLSKTPESDRPGLVVIVILTDGLENASREFSSAKIKEMIDHQREVYKWQFTYLGANQDAFAVAAKMGIPTAGTSPYAASASPKAFAAAAENVVRMRVASAGGQHVNNTYTSQERKAMAGDEEEEKK